MGDCGAEANGTEFAAEIADGHGSTECNRPSDCTKIAKKACECGSVFAALAILV